DPGMVSSGAYIGTASFWFALLTKTVAGCSLSSRPASSERCVFERQSRVHQWRSIMFALPSVGLRRGSWCKAAFVMASATVALWQATPALAWKPKTHVYLAEIAYKDAVDDGFFTIYETDYQTGTVKRNSDGSPVVIGKYPVNPAVLAALRSNPAHFRAGVLGPDAYPDIATGQQIIHPAGKKGNGETEADLNRGGPGPDEWLRHLWNLAY